MKTPIIYVTVSSEQDFFLEELWISAYSVRLYNPDAIIKVLVDKPTEERIKDNSFLMSLLTEVVVVPVPDSYTAKERSRHIKTTIREQIEGAFFYIDTDTVICKSLDEIDTFDYEIAGVPDANTPLANSIFGYGFVNTVRRVFDCDISDCEFICNGGVLYVSDSEKTHEFFKKWNKKWAYSCFVKGNSQDQPALMASNKEMGYIIKKIPDIYNSQVAMSLKYFADAAIIHFLHMSFIPDQTYSPYLSLQIYRDLRKYGKITKEIDNDVKNCKTSFAYSTMPVGESEIRFLFTPMGQTMVRIYNEGGAASWLMLKIAGLLEKIHKYTKKRD